MKPRESLLSQFDPLSSNTRDAHSPSSSEKENESLFQVTSLEPYPQSRAFKKRLIDFGDETVDDMSYQISSLDITAELEDTEVVEDETIHRQRSFSLEEMDTVTPPRTAGTLSALATPGPRTPLAEVDISVEYAPLPRKKTDGRMNYHQRVHTATLPPLGTIANNPQIIVSSESSSMLNSSISIAPPSDRSILLTNIPFVSPGDENSLLPSPRPRPRSNTTGVDPRRLSMDLQTSFMMSGAALDSSFDLLNDKMSFLGESSFGRDASASFGRGDSASAVRHSFDDSFEFDLKIEEAAMEALASKEADTTPNSHIKHTTEGTSTSQESTPEGPKVKRRSSIASVSLLPSPTAAREPVFSRPARNDNRRLSLAIKTPLPAETPPPSPAVEEAPKPPQPATSGLRVVKRHPKEEPVASSSVTSSTIPPRPALRVPVARRMSLAAPSTTVKGPVRQKSGSAVEVTAVPVSRTVSNRLPTISSRISVPPAPPKATTLRPRPSISIQPPAAGARRVPVATSAAIPPRQPASRLTRVESVKKPIVGASGSGIRAPSRFGAVLLTSSLPRPGTTTSSRLPAPRSAFGSRA